MCEYRLRVQRTRDRLQELQTRVNEFEALGTQHVWVIDPWKRVAYYASSRGFQMVSGDVLQVEDTPIRLSLTEIFSELDEG
jgi:Uma2 family endonuclease